MEKVVRTNATKCSSSELIIRSNRHRCMMMYCTSKRGTVLASDPINNVIMGMLSLHCEFNPVRKHHIYDSFLRTILVSSQAFEGTASFPFSGAHVWCHCVGCRSGRWDTRRDWMLLWWRSLGGAVASAGRSGRANGRRSAGRWKTQTWSKQRRNRSRRSTTSHLARKREGKLTVCGFLWNNTSICVKANQMLSILLYYKESHRSEKSSW